MDDRLKLLESARAIGFREFEVRFEPLPDTPVVVGSVEGGLNLEISAYARTPERRPFFYMVDGGGGVVRVEVTDGLLDHPPSTIDGVEVRTVSPLAQYQIRAGIAAAGGFGPMRPKDVEAQRALQERFFPGEDPATLAPPIVPLG